MQETHEVQMGMGNGLRPRTVEGQLQGVIRRTLLAANHNAFAKRCDDNVVLDQVFIRLGRGCGIDLRAASDMNEHEGTHTGNRQQATRRKERKYR